MLATAAGMFLFFHRKGWIRIARLRSTDVSPSRGEQALQDAGPRVATRVKVLEVDRETSADRVDGMKGSDRSTNSDLRKAS